MKLGGTNSQAHFQKINPENPFESEPCYGDTAEPKKHDTLFSLAQRKQRQDRYRNLANLKPWQDQQLREADNYATKIEKPLNRFVTVSWRFTDYGNFSAHAFQRATHRMRQWFRDRGIEPAWIYVHENPLSEMGDEKPNTHMLMHLPRKITYADLSGMLERAFNALDGGINVQPRKKFGWSGQDSIQYMTKGADQLTCRIFGGFRKKGGQGNVESLIYPSVGFPYEMYWKSGVNRRCDR